MPKFSFELKVKFPENLQRERLEKVVGQGRHSAVMLEIEVFREIVIPEIDVSHEIVIPEIA